jgi:shikimate kinase
MSRVILVVGPSGAGKSDYGRHAAKAVPRCEFFDLDGLVGKRSGTPASQLLPKIGNDAFLHRCQQEIEALQNSRTETAAIVAVGAGALQSDQAHAWLSGYPGPTVAVLAPNTEVYSRGSERNRNRSLEEFTATEYSERRQRLYETAKYRCCVGGLSVEAARGQFTDLIRGLLRESSPDAAA